MTTTTPSLVGRRALVTGSTRGIGRAIAAALAQAGADVIVHGREADLGAEVAGEIGGRFVAADLADPAQLARMCEDVGEQPLDVLVNNAGMEVHAEIADLDRDVLTRVLEVNLLAPVELTRLLLPALRRGTGPCVLNVTSIHATVPVRGNSAYAMAKAALDMYTRNAAIELAASGIRVNALAPGAVETDMNRDLIDEVGRDRFATWIPWGRVGEAHEVGPAAVFLCSDAASYVTGATLVVDGGYSQHLVRYGRD